MRLNPKYDVVILGGGPSGLTTALTIARHSDLSVLVVEAQAPQQERIGENCPPNVLVLLEGLGLLERFRQEGHGICPGYASMWGTPRPGYNDFIVSPYGPSWRLDRKKFDWMLAEAASRAGVTFAWSHRFHSLENAQKGFRLMLTGPTNKNPFPIEAGFVVDATGSKARFAAAMGIEKDIQDQLFATVRFAQIASGDISDQVHIESTPWGWWYTTLLPDRRLVTMMVTELEGLHALRLEEMKGFDAAVQATQFVGAALQSLRLNDPTFHTWPIYSGILPSVCGDNWIAVGDAASSFDPVAAQGIYKGMEDGYRAGQMIAQHFQGIEFPRTKYQQTILKRYEAYLKNRAHVYGLERRWPEMAFWKNRANSFNV